MEVSKESMKINESNSDLKGKKFTSKASGGSLAEGTAHQVKCGDVDGMYRPEDKLQRPVKGHDRI